MKTKDKNEMNNNQENNKTLKTKEMNNIQENDIVLNNFEKDKNILENTIIDNYNRILIDGYIYLIILLNIINISVKNTKYNKKTKDIFDNVFRNR